MTEHASRGGEAAPELTPHQQVPLLSIIVVVFQAKDELLEVVRSILPFHSSMLELVVVDGGSSDGTLETLQSFGKTIDAWVSEADAGIYDAMNKGLRMARGTYVLHINAGDRLLTVPWHDLEGAAKDRVDVLCCRVLLDDERVFISRTGLLSKLDNTWHHQGTFYRRAAHLGYDTAFPTGADCHHNHRLLRTGCTYRECEAVVAFHASGGVSTGVSGQWELLQSVRENFGSVWVLLARLRFGLRAIRDRRLANARRRGGKPVL